MASTREEAQARAELRGLINGFQISQALSVMAALGIADLLAVGERPSDQIAAQTGTHPPYLYRLLRAVASLGVLEERPGRVFRLTPLGDGLRSDAPGSLAGWATFIGRRHHWLAWSRLEEGLRTGAHPFRIEHGTDPWTYRAQRPDEALIFSRAMNSISALAADDVLDAYDFGRFRRVVDVGGGGGALIAAILTRNPRCQGVLFDQQHVVAGAREFIKRAGLVERCELLSGSFFESIPAGADAYVLKSILHDWYDEDASRILASCRAAMTPEATLVLVERVVGPPNQDPATTLSDLNMMVAAGGCERTAEEWAELLAGAGFRLCEVHPAGMFSVLEAVPAPLPGSLG